MRTAGLAMLMTAWASSVSAQCADAPSFDAPDWGAVIAGLTPLGEAAARAHIARAEERADADLFSLAEAYRAAHAASDDAAMREGAIRAYERILTEQPRHPKLALALYRLGRLHEGAGARRYHARLAGEHPLSPYTVAMYVDFAEQRLAIGDRAAAANYAERAAVYHDRASLPPSALGAYARYLHAWALRHGDASAARVRLDEARAAASRARSRALLSAIDRDRCAFEP